MFLIVQGRDISTSDLKHLAKTVNASAIESVVPRRAFRMIGAIPSSDIASFCEQAALDWAFVPENRRLADFRLAVMDMDSTLITIECIDEIADCRGFKERVAEITEAAMRGQIDFSESLRQRVALLEGTREEDLIQVYEERLRLSPGAEQLLMQLRENDIKTLLVSGGFTFFTDRLAQRLGLDYTRSNTLEIIGGRLTGLLRGEIVDGDGKRAALERVRTELGLKREQVMGIGDGANDLKFMAACGLSIAYHAKLVVRAHATHALNFVGLDGALHLFN